MTGRLAGINLNDAGRAQAEKLAERLREVPIAAIYSSPLERTVQTAQPLASRISKSVVTRERLIEIEIGEWSGLTFEQLDKDPLWRRFNKFRSSTRAPGGELMLDVQSRITDEMEDLRGRHEGQTVALFSHADVIKAAVAHYAGIPLDLFHRIQIDPASVSVIGLGFEEPRVLRLNDTGDPIRVDF
jgi:probable phosphoglycerate mutase